MKKALYFWLIIIGIGAFTACQSDSKTVKAPENKQQQIKKKKAPQKKKIKPLPTIDRLKKSERGTNGSIHFINGIDIRKTKEVPRITDEFIEIKGVAIDRPAKKTAAGVYLKIGDQFFKTRYGRKNRALSRKLKSKKYDNAGFSVKIPKSKLKEGDYDIGVFVVSRSRKSYYQLKKETKIKIR